MKGRRIEIYNSFEESHKALLSNYAELTPQQCWLKGHELSDCFNKKNLEEEPGVFSIYLNE